MPRPERLDGVMPSAAPIYAAIDVGTNNCRMLIVRTPLPVKGETVPIRILESFSRIVRLGEGIHHEKKLSEAAMERAIDALGECSKRLREYDVFAAKYVTTEACRVATNCDEFLGRVLQKTGIKLEVLEQHREAELAFKGCVSLLQPETENAMVIDIGGGSTEVLWASVANAEQVITDWLSMPWGVMSITEKFRPGKFVDIPFEHVVEHIRKELEVLEVRNHIRQVIGKHHVQMLCTSGTVTTLAAIHLDLKRYNRNEIDGIVLSHEEVLESIQAMRQMSQSERCTHPCIGPDRADYILGGCAIMQAILEQWPAPSITIADRGLREGIVSELIRANSPHDG